MPTPHNVWRIVWALAVWWRFPCLDPMVASWAVDKWYRWFFPPATQGPHWPGWEKGFNQAPGKVGQRAQLGSKPPHPLAKKGRDLGTRQIGLNQGGRPQWANRHQPRNSPPHWVVPWKNPGKKRKMNLGDPGLWWGDKSHVSWWSSVEQQPKPQDNIPHVPVVGAFGKVFKSHSQGNGRQGRFGQLKGDELACDGGAHIGADHNANRLL